MAAPAPPQQGAALYAQRACSLAGPGSSGGIRVSEVPGECGASARPSSRMAARSAVIAQIIWPPETAAPDVLPGGAQENHQRRGSSSLWTISWWIRLGRAVRPVRTRPDHPASWPPWRHE